MIAVLDDMRQFMRDQAPARLRSQPAGLSFEHHVMAEGVGAGVDGPRGRIGLGIVVHSHMAEIPAETRFEETEQSRG